MVYFSGEEKGCSSYYLLRFLGDRIFDQRTCGVDCACFDLDLSRSGDETKVGILEAPFFRSSVDAWNRLELVYFLAVRR